MSTRLKLLFVSVFLFFLFVAHGNMLNAAGSFCFDYNLGFGANLQSCHMTQALCDAEELFQKNKSGQTIITPCTEIGGGAPVLPIQPTSPAPNILAPYVPISPIEGVTSGAPSTPGYLNNLFKFGIGIAAVLAVLMLVICGFKYVTTESFGGKGDAKNCIWAAIGGLLIVLTAWLVLNTINPDLVQFNFFSIKPYTFEKTYVPFTNPTQTLHDVNGAVGAFTKPGVEAWFGSNLPELLILPYNKDSSCKNTYSDTVVFKEKIYEFHQPSYPIPPWQSNWPADSYACSYTYKANVK